MKVQKRPITVDAWRVTDLINRYIAYGYEGLPEPIASAYEDGIIDFPSGFVGLANGKPERIDVITLEGIMQAPHGWWIVKGALGEFYPVKNDDFWQTFDLPDPEPRLVTG